MRKLHVLVAAIGASILMLLTACGSTGVPDAKNWDIEDFSYSDQEGKPFSKSDLKGKVWVADFIFTSCETVCLPMTSNMAKLQQQLKDEGIKDVEFVSFSVDPEIDKPDVLKKFGDQFNVDYKNWHFLTGYDQQEIEQFALDNFKTVVKKPEKEDQVIHGTSFFLMDQEGKIIRDYTGLQDIPFEDIIKHIKILQNY
ncbi:SCO family protein [Peribacillus muralis]|uniref:SCO family protein n=1 Tax=Peribacillus muralis TaxID=264697 RepID=UPI001F4EB0DC|nr:SCO family protein [Peribacillus muralis]MCK1991146.1 SCO family protein [Peribacillus muralis]MCK2011700.1 SCO family protein [Peribacillus muralis]